ncbi:MAG TPA: glucosidase [Caulifigura sp.]|nr:glucosidase [Caulifigura sp.]
MTAEDQRLADSTAREANWKRWGPYLSERQWGTVREDYSKYGDSWGYLPHDHARSRAYRWGEDGLLGITDRECRLCFAVALWNGKDPILKERLFGLTNDQGNHGEDVKECYYYLDSSPTHSYLKALYKYPQAEYPYARLVAENGSRSRYDREFELEETGLFDDSRYFDVQAEYAKASPDDILIRITVSNRGPDAATVHVLPTLWFRNTWSWGCEHEGCELKPKLERTAKDQVGAWHASLGQFDWVIGPSSDGSKPLMIFTENETNFERVFGTESPSEFKKDGFHDFVIHDKSSAFHPEFGTKAAARFVLNIPAGGQVVLPLRLVERVRDPHAPLSLVVEPLDSQSLFGPAFDQVFADRIRETDEYYSSHLPAMPEPERQVARQAYAGLLWTKQFYHYSIREWLDGDPAEPTPPQERKSGRNAQWTHLFNRDVISMPDKWEYPWYAAWDLAFHMIPFAKVDPEFAKEQLILLLREWYMHPNGQIPAYEFAFGDVNPPVHAWAAWRVYKMTGARGHRDVVFLKRVFHKLLINFTWWVNRKDVAGKHLFAGGFLGLDNIGVFDRSQPLPTGGSLEQADGTAWMAFYCATMLSIALEIARFDDSYEDVASKFLEHFVEIVDAMHTVGNVGLWDEEDGFYYDVLRTDGYTTPLRIRSMVGIIPLFAVEVLEQETIDQLPGFKKRMEWFLNHRRDLAAHVTYCRSDAMPGEAPDRDNHRLLAIPSRDRLERVLKYVLDENEFLSPHGVRALSRVHKDDPYVFHLDDRQLRVSYVSGESTSNLFGGNSNWRGPVWFPVNFLLIEALERYHHFYGDELQVEFPTGSGTKMNLKQVAAELSKRLTTLFLPDSKGARPAHGADGRYSDDPHWKDLILFYEYFDGDNGRGLGASHQTGWTALVAKLLEDLQSA